MPVTPENREQLGSVAYLSGMDVTIQYFDGCPNWQTARDHLQAAVEQCGSLDVRVSWAVVDTEEKAVACGFRGSPTILVDGLDPFADPDAGVGLSCRLFATDGGLAGAPTVEMLVRALRHESPQDEPH